MLITYVPSHAQSSIERPKLEIDTFKDTNIDQKQMIMKMNNDRKSDYLAIMKSYL